MKTTKKDFQIYQEEANKWIEFFGLKDWCITFQHKEQDDLLSENSGWAEVDVDSHMACISLNKTWIDDKELHTEESIRFIAFHEASEVLLAEMDYLARQRFNLDEKTIDTVRHAVIHRLENSLYRRLNNDSTMSQV